MQVTSPRVFPKQWRHLGARTGEKTHLGGGVSWPMCRGIFQPAKMRRVCWASSWMSLDGNSPVRLASLWCFGGRVLSQLPCFHPRSAGTFLILYSCMDLCMLFDSSSALVLWCFQLWWGISEPGIATHENSCPALGPGPIFFLFGILFYQRSVNFFSANDKFFSDQML